MQRIYLAPAESANAFVLANVRQGRFLVAQYDRDRAYSNWHVQVGHFMKRPVQWCERKPKTELHNSASPARDSNTGSTADNSCNASSIESRCSRNEQERRCGRTDA